MFLKQLIEAGGYRSESQMAIALGERQETVNGWRGSKSKRGPSKLEAFLRRYADRHNCDATALVERWAIVPHGSLVHVAPREVEPVVPGPATRLEEDIDASILAVLLRIERLLETRLPPLPPTQR